MTDKKTFRVSFRRRKEGKTDYAKRLALIKANKNRLVVRKSNRQVLASVVKEGPKGDQSIAFATSRELGQFGWKGGLCSLPAGYLTGLLAGRKAGLNGQKEAILDLGRNTSHHGGVLFAVAKGAKDSGLQIPIGEDALPSAERISGQHISKFAEKLSSEDLEKRFGGRLKNGFDPKKTVQEFEKAKKMILDAKENQLKTKKG